MRNFFKNYYWVLMIFIFALAMLAMYRIVDVPEKVYGAEDDPFDIPQSVIDATEKWGAVYSISPEFMQAVFYEESRYNPDAVNKAGTCFGLGQIKASCHGKRMKKLGVTNLFDVDGNTAVSCDYFAELFEEYEDPAIVLGIYHGEPDAIWKAETGNLSGYTKRILQRTIDYEYVHHKKEIEKLSNFKNLTVQELKWEQAMG